MCRASPWGAALVSSLFASIALPPWRSAFSQFALVVKLGFPVLAFGSNCAVKPSRLRRAAYFRSLGLIVGIWPPYQAFYSLSINFCTQSAARSIASLAELMREIDEAKSLRILNDVDQESVLNEVQNIIVQGAAVSRYFWPARDKYEERGIALRSMYGIAENSPLRSRDLRNAIEHFDEKLDEYLSKGIVGNIFPHYIGPEPKSSGVPQHFFRAYYIDTGVFQILNQRVEIEPLSRELWRLGRGEIRDET